jgi:hypothetical protein
MDLGLHYWNFSEPPDVAKIATPSRRRPNSLKSKGLRSSVLSIIPTGWSTSPR